jgi:peptidoglycan hydrolase CwlO-like protein
MGEILQVFSIIKGAPTEFSLGISFFIAILVIWMKSRDIDISAATSISKLQMDQMKGLMEQNKQLSKDLQELHDKLSETYDKVNDLRNQVSQLEELVRQYKRKCDNCPGPGGRPPSIQTL